MLLSLCAIRTKSLILVGLIFASSVWGQTVAPARLTLREALQRTRQNHPLLVAAQQRVAMFEGELLEAGLRPNPTFTISGENFPLDPPEGGFKFNRTIDWFAYFSHTLERGNKRALREATAARAVQVAKNEVSAVERQLIYETKIAYERAAAARERLELLRENSQQLGQLVNLNEVRVKAGYTAEGDLIKVRLEAQRIDYYFRKATLDFDQLKIGLLKAMGNATFDADFDLAERMEFQPAILNAALLQQAALQRPNLQVIAARLAHAQSTLQLQLAQAKPDITASFGYKRNGADNALYGALNIPLPLYNKNQGMIARARAEIAMIEAELQFERGAINAELFAARRAVEAHQRLVENMRNEFLRNAEESQQVTLASYREGATDLLHVIDAQRVRVQAQELYLQALTDYQVALHELERAAGIEFLPRREIVAGTKP